MNAFHYFLIFAKVDLEGFFQQIIFLVRMRSLSSLVSLEHQISSSYVMALGWIGPRPYGVALGFSGSFL